MLLSHPNKKLINHLENVKNIGLKAFDDKAGLNLPYSRDDIRKTLEIVLFYHDIGKATIFFQDYLRASIKNRQCNHKQDLINHSLISALIASHIVKINTDSWFLSKLAFAAVRKHHGNLENFDEMFATKKKDILKEQFLSLELNDFHEIQNLKFEDLWNTFDELLWIDEDEKIENYFLLNFIFSLLIYSDKTEVIFTDTNTPGLPKNISHFVDNYKKVNFSTENRSQLNEIRNSIYEESLVSLKNIYQNGRIYSLNVPTGSGKTLTALNLSFNLLHNESSLKRIVYALPFTSIVDQTETVIQDIFRANKRDTGDFLIVHHHLAEAKIKVDENYIEKDKAQFLIENWDKPLILTTFWQLFYTIISNKNVQLRKFHNIANSIIILDEVQTIPYRYWDLAKAVLEKLTEMFNCRVIFLTATMPLIFKEENKEILPLISKDSRNRYFSSFSRYKLNLLKNADSIADINIENLYEIAKKEIRENGNKSFLFVFNTIKSSISFYNKFKEDFYDKDLIYLSTNILPIERKKRIEEIKKDSNNKIVVSTQLIEAGVDIDLDIVYRDFAPLDSVIQSAGRCNRNSDKKIGRISIFRLKNEDGKFDYNLIYKGLTLTETEKLFFHRNSFEEPELIEIINSYYEGIKNHGSQDESLKILKGMKNMNYEEIYDKFRLIDEIPSFLMFFEVDDKAKNILERFKEIFSIKDKFERKSEFLAIKSEFYQYMLSVKFSKNTKSYFTSFEEIGNFRIVERNFVNSVYDFETGLKREWSSFV